MTAQRYRWILNLALLVVALALPLSGSNYLAHIGALILIYVSATLGLHLLMGLAGQMSIGHGALMAVGGFSAQVFMSKLGWSFWLAFPAAVVASGIFGYLIALPMVRLRGIYLAVGTLGVGIVVPDLLQRWRSVSGGWAGVAVPPIMIGDMKVETVGIYYIALLLAIACWAFAEAISKSRLGRAFVALRDSETASLSSGINVAAHRHLAFLLSAAIAGAAGVVYVELVGRAIATNFNLWLSIWFLATLAVGGIGRSDGAVYGAILLTFMEQVFLQTAGLAFILTGFLIIVISFFLPRGLAGLVDDLLELISRSPTVPRADKEVA